MIKVEIVTQYGAAVACCISCNNKASHRIDVPGSGGLYFCKHCTRELVRELAGKCGNCKHFIGIDGKNFRVCELESGLGMIVEATDYCSRWEADE